MKWGNDKLRIKNLLASFLIIFFAINFSAVSAAQQARWNNAEDVDKFPTEVLRLVNAERAKVGALPLKLAKDLSASAYVRARELPYKFSHTRPNGSKCFTAMPQIGHMLGENLAGGQKTPKDVVQAWMDSKTHRDNMLNKTFTELGVAYYYQSNSKYKYYWVQHFRG